MLAAGNPEHILLPHTFTFVKKAVESITGLVLRGFVQLLKAFTLPTRESGMTKQAVSPLY